MNIRQWDDLKAKLSPEQQGRMKEKTSVVLGSRVSYFTVVWRAIRHEYWLRQRRRNCRADRYIDDEGNELARDGGR